MNIGGKKIALSDIIVIITILSLQLLFSISELFSSSQLENNVFGLDFDLNTFLWVLVVKLNIIILLIVWYLTCKHWWRISIVIPLTIELFKFVSFINPKVEVFDEIDFITSVPITLPIVLLLLVLSKKVNHYSSSQLVYLSVNKEIERVFHEISSENVKNEIEEKFYILKTKKKLYTKSKYLDELIALRDKMY